MTEPTSISAGAIAVNLAAAGSAAVAAPVLLGSIPTLTLFGVDLGIEKGVAVAAVVGAALWQLTKEAQKESNSWLDRFLNFATKLLLLCGAAMFGGLATPVVYELLLPFVKLPGSAKLLLGLIFGYGGLQLLPKIADSIPLTASAVASRFLGHKEKVEKEAPK